MVITSDMIRRYPFFADLSSEQIAVLASVAEGITAQTGDYIFHEDDDLCCFYIVIEGKVCLESYVPGFGAMPVFTAESLDVIGWSSLTPVVRQKPGTARILEPTKCLTFDSNMLMGLCEADCDLGFVIMRRLANIVASRLLNHRLHLLEIISSQQKQSTQ